MAQKAYRKNEGLREHFGYQRCLQPRNPRRFAEGFNMRKLAFVAGAAAILFAIGVILLHLNPYWRNDPGLPMVIDKRVHLWSGVGHLVCAVGLVGSLGGAAFIL